MTDNRTPAQHKADVAACTLDRLQRIAPELELLIWQLGMLGDYADEHPELGINGAFLRRMGGHVWMLAHLVPEVVRDIASRLPIRGLDFGGEEAES
ncbi:hypothetical protein [Nocardia terpenica]|uniref:Uncharacterized protein n=1 Tax=Nocardia terpenica TaxID=455432 RepID=A0A6G9Z1H9_9NOCA|nr:hypothetical protein [Nocardia terpenica]QIS19217.1 hypothetical protein F6W96_13870 [Nocardia terpenica]